MRLILNIIWLVLVGIWALVLCGWWLALVHLIGGIALCITIIGIPLGLGNFKLIPISLWPMGREIVDIDDVGSADIVIG